MATQNNIIVRNECNHHEKPCEKFFSENSKSNVTKFLNTLGALDKPDGHKGLWTLYGNAFSGEEEFVGIGEIRKGDTNWENGNFTYPWYSQAKISSYICVAKMLEEGLVNMEDSIAKYYPDCSGNAYYITSIQTNPDANNPNIDPTKPLTWKVNYGTFNLNTITVGTCLQFNIGIPFGIYAVFQTGYNFLYNPVFVNQIIASGLPGQSMLYVLSRYNDVNRRGVKYDIVTEILKGKQFSIRESISNWINFTKKNPLTDPDAIPFAFKPNDPTDNLLPFKIRGLMHSYSMSLDILAAGLDVICKNNGYNSLGNYLRVKILNPLGMKSCTYTLSEKYKTEYKTLDYAFNRAKVISSKDASGNLTPESFACDPKYIDDGKSGLTVWSKDYPNDGIARWGYLSDEIADPTDVLFFNGSLRSTPHDFSKIYKMLIKGGINESGERVLDPSSVNWVLSPKVNSLVNLTNVYPFAQDGDNVTWCGGHARFNYDNNNASSALVSQYVYYWGGALGTMGLFDLKSGHYCIIGASELSLGSFPYPYRTHENILKILLCAIRK